MALLNKVLAISNEAKQIAELTARLEHLEQETTIFVERAARWQKANQLIIHSLYVALKEVAPGEVENISDRLEHIRAKTNGDAHMFEAIEDAMRFFK